jgi:hypothetical protein
LPNVPWYAGITALQAMVIGEAMYQKNFSFRVVYRSIFGAFIDSIDGVTDDPGKQLYWMLYINGQEADVGASEVVIQEDESITSAAVDWRYVDVSKATHRQATLKAKVLPNRP